MATSILIIDDHDIFRTGVKLVLEQAIANIVIHQAENVGEAISSVDEAVDVILLDIKLSGMNGLDGITHIEKQWPSIPILVLSSQDDSQTQKRARELGAKGFISKASAANDVVQNILDILDSREGLKSEHGMSQPHSLAKPLTPRQNEVFELIKLGLSNKLIARELDLAHNTVRRHVQDILKHFDASTRTEAILASRRFQANNTSLTDS